MPAPVIWLLAAASGLAIGWLLGARRQRGQAAHRAEGVTRRLRALTAHIESVVEGSAQDLGEPSSKEDAVGGLARAVHRLHQRALAQRDEATDAAKRRAVALNSLVIEIDQLAYAASHDLRAPLQNIERLVGFLKEDLAEAELGDETRQSLALIGERVQRMHALLTSVAEFARAGRGLEEPDETSLPELVAQVGEELQLGEGFPLRWEGEPESVNTAAEPLQAVLTHLVDNAVQHHDRGRGVIVVGGELVEDQLRLSVTDDGPGIPAKQHRRIFEMFRTLERRDVKEAVGMGLPIVRRVVESLGGRITVDSPVADGRGTRMTFTWPREWPQTGTVVQAFGSSLESRMMR